jgi:AraC family transcriptional regulator
MIEVVQRPSLAVVGLHIRTRPMSPEIPRIWPGFVARIAEIEGRAESRVTYGVMWHEPGTLDTLHYMACVAASPPAPVPPGMERLAIPAGEWASFRYPLSRLGEGFGEIFNELLPRSAWEQAPGPYFERYDESFCPDEPASLVQICLPVRRKHGVTP